MMEIGDQASFGIMMEASIPMVSRITLAKLEDHHSPDPVRVLQPLINLGRLPQDFRHHFNGIRSIRGFGLYRSSNNQ
jgi:hypothetical protein